MARPQLHTILLEQEAAIDALFKGAVANMRSRILAEKQPVSIDRIQHIIKAELDTLFGSSTATALSSPIGKLVLSYANATRRYVMQRVLADMQIVRGRRAALERVQEDLASAAIIKEANDRLDPVLILLQTSSKQAVAITRDMVDLEGISDRARDLVLGVLDGSRHGNPRAIAELRAAAIANAALVTAFAAGAAFPRTIDDTALWLGPDGRRLADRLHSGQWAIRRIIGQRFISRYAHTQRLDWLLDEIERYLVADYIPRRTVAGRIVPSAKPGNFTARGSGKGSFVARRIGRGEIARAYGDIMKEVIRRSEITPAVRWVLNPAHPGADECAPAGTMITTINGDMPIEEIAVGDLVLTHAGRYRPVTRLYRRSVEARALVTLLIQEEKGRSHHLTVTRNHPVLTDRGWIAAGDLRTGQDRIAVASLAGGIVHLHHRCVPDRASQGSARNVPAAERETAASGQYGGALPVPRTQYTDLQGGRSPMRAPLSASGICQCCCAPRANSDSMILFGSAKSSCAYPAASTNFLDGDSHSSDSPLRSALGRTSESSNAGSPTPEGCDYRTSRTFELGLRDRPSSTPCCKTDDRSRSLVLETSSRNERTRSSGSIDPIDVLARTSCCRTDGEHTGEDAEFYPGDRWAVGIVRSSLSYVDDTVIRSNDPVPVYNFAVADDNSYVAEGVVVHNCDDLAERSSPGLPPGCYRYGDVPFYPNHFGCLCSLELVDIEGRTPEEARKSR